MDLVGIAAIITALVAEVVAWPTILTPTEVTTVIDALVTTYA